MKKIEKEIMTEFEKYRVQLLNTKTINDTTYKHMNSAIYGCKLIVEHLFKNAKSAKL